MSTTRRSGLTLCGRCRSDEWTAGPALAGRSETPRTESYVGQRVTANPYEATTSGATSRRRWTSWVKRVRAAVICCEPVRSPVFGTASQNARVGHLMTWSIAARRRCLLDYRCILGKLYHLRCFG